jgi:hypothetical protein
MDFVSSSGARGDPVQQAPAPQAMVGEDADWAESLLSTKRRRLQRSNSGPEWYEVIVFSV